MNVDIFHLARVDPLAAYGIGLIGQPKLDAIGACERAVEFGSCRGSSPNADLEGFARLVKTLDAPGESCRHGFWISSAGEAAHSNVGAGGDERGCIGSRHNLAREGRTKHARSVQIPLHFLLCWLDTISGAYAAVQ